MSEVCNKGGGGGVGVRGETTGTVIQAGRIRCRTKYMVSRVTVVIGGWRGGEGVQKMVKLFLLGVSIVVVKERKILVMIRTAGKTH